MFKVKIVTSTGTVDDLNCYIHTQAFRRAIDIENTNRFAYIEERQWCSVGNRLVTKTYYAKNKSIFVTDDTEAPVYSHEPSFLPDVTFRLFVHALLKKAISIYRYLNMKCPFSDEYFYGYGRSQLTCIQMQIMADPYVRLFYAEVLPYINEIIDIMKLTDIPPAEFLLTIVNIEPEKLIDSLKTIKKKLKNFILKKVYGATYIDEFPL